MSHFSLGTFLFLLNFVFSPNIGEHAFIPDENKKSVKDSMEIRNVIFSGLNWNVRSGKGNPGGNYWSDSSESVWVDSLGQLHLKIRNENGKWFCSEIYTEESVGYGEYRFYISGIPENLDENVVLGLFTYLDDRNEIDIEFSKWGKAGQNKIGNYVIQPAAIMGNQKKFPLNCKRETTHQFIWETEKVAFKSWMGHSSLATDSTIIYEWDYFGKHIPVPGKEKLMINFWLFRGTPPTGESDMEIIIKAVEVKTFSGTN